MYNLKAKGSLKARVKKWKNKNKKAVLINMGTIQLTAELALYQVQGKHHSLSKPPQFCFVLFANYVLSMVLKLCRETVMQNK